MKKNYTQQCSEACKFSMYGSISPEDKKNTGDAKFKKTGFFCIHEIPEFKQAVADIKLMSGWWKALGLVSQEELDKLNISNSKSLLNNAWRMMDKSELIIDDIPTTNLEVVGEYVQKFMVLGKIYRGELTEEEERYFKVGALKFINGELIKDEDKYNQAMAVL
jgi:hypothetical protein